MVAHNLNRSVYLLLAQTAAGVHANKRSELIMKNLRHIAFEIQRREQQPTQTNNFNVHLRDNKQCALFFQHVFRILYICLCCSYTFMYVNAIYQSALFDCEWVQNFLDMYLFNLYGDSKAHGGRRIVVQHIARSHVSWTQSRIWFNSHAASVAGMLIALVLLIILPI